MKAKRKPSVVLCYKNFAANKHISHIGLGVSAINTSKCLIRAGIPTQVWSVVSGDDLRQRLNQAKADKVSVTHVVISAPWIPTAGLNQLCSLFPDIRFAVNCHSNVGFLQADANGVKLLREALELEMGVHNFRVSGNSRKFSRWIHDAYGSPCEYLPNLYFLDEHTNSHRPLWHGGALRIGAFGATRPLKNFLSSVGAAIELSFQLKAQTEFYMNSGRTEGGGDTILRAARELVSGLPQISLYTLSWACWPKFKRAIGNMHLLMQPSYTESFNMVTADGISQGVPSVVSDAIDWAPSHWKAQADDVLDIAKRARYLIADPNAAGDGLRALSKHNDDGLASWLAYFRKTQAP